MILLRYGIAVFGSLFLGTFQLLNAMIWIEPIKTDLRNRPTQFEDWYFGEPLICYDCGGLIVRNDIKKWWSFAPHYDAPIFPAPIIGKPDLPHWPIQLNRRNNSHEGLPISRYPPQFPRDAVRSGHCHFTAEVSVEGKVVSVSTFDCTESIFEQSTKNAVLKWRFHPKYDDGTAIPFTSESYQIKWVFRNDHGIIIPSRTD